MIPLDIQASLLLDLEMLRREILLGAPDSLRLSDAVGGLLAHADWLAAAELVDPRQVSNAEYSNLLRLVSIFPTRNPPSTLLSPPFRAYPKAFPAIALHPTQPPAADITCPEVQHVKD